MTSFRNTLLILLLSACTISVSSSNSLLMDSLFYVDGDEDDAKTMTLTVTINSTSSTKMKNVPKTGFLEVYSILGQRVKKVNLEECENGAFIELTKGLYILKAGKIAQKVIVK